ncbi:hypothetical protein ABKV19_026478 [Rosa sericea]
MSLFQLGINVLSRKARNQYTWKGFRAIPNALQELKEEGLKENFNTFHGNFQGNDDPKCSQSSDDEEGDESGHATGSQNENPSVNPKSSGNSKNVHLVDAHLCSGPAKYVSALLLSLSTMIDMELPRINVFSKIDLIQNYGKLGRRHIPQGLPSFSIPKAFGYATSLIPTALLITGVAILLFGLGVANIFGSFFSAYPTTGSFSRSAVNNESGAKTGLCGIVMGFIMGCALLFMTTV